MMRWQSTFKEILKKVEFIWNCFIVDRSVFSHLETIHPSVTTIDFCNINESQLLNLHADRVIATDVVGNDFHW